MLKKKSKKEETSHEEQPLEIKKTGLIIGVLLSFAGVIGVMGLRAGFIQSLLGDASAYPGIGTAEPIGHIVSVIPTVLGLVMIMSWGIKNDSIYYELEKSKKEDASEEIEDFVLVDDEIDSDEVEDFIPVDDEIDEDESEEIIPADDELDEDEVEEIIPVDDDVPSKLKEPLDEVPEEKMEDKSLDDLENELEDVLDDIAQEIDKAPAKVSKPIKAAPKPTKAVPKPSKAPKLDKVEIAEQIRIERCEKMLKVAVTLPEDKKKLKALISTGISAAKFTKQIRAAIERRKKREEEKDVTSDEKASILEDELVAELAELEDELDEDTDHDELEDQIFKELEDLEGL